MRLLHTSDLHLGISLGGVSLLREQELMTQQLCTLAQEENLDGVLLAGDIFDRAAASAEAIALYDRFLTELASICPVFVIAGNHDGAARLSSLNRLLTASGLYVAGSLRQKPEPVVFGNAEIYLIPYFNPEQVRLLYPEREIRSSHDAMLALMDDIRARRDNSKRTVVVAHCFVTGAVLTESDGAAALGGASQVGAEVFTALDYVALGHLHRAQTPTGTVRYSGSPYPYSFAEGEKSVFIYDTETNVVQTVSLQYPRVLRAITGAYGEIMVMPESEDYLRIELTDRGAGLETLSALRAKFANLIVLMGKHNAENPVDTLTIEELQSLSPRELVERFCEEIGGEGAAEELVDAFLDALEQAERGGGEQ